MAKVIGGPREFANPDDPETKISEYVRLSVSIDSLELRKKELRDDMFAILDEDGLEDDKGNLLYAFSAPIEGVIRLEKQRRTSRKLDEDAATDIIEATGIADSVYKTVRVIDEDALMAQYYEGNITEEQIDQMFPTTVIWALRLPKK
jgi:hypothetical protein